MPFASDRDRCAHLLRRFGLGASESELDFYLQSGGLNGAIERLLNYEAVDEGFTANIADYIAKDPKVKNPLPMGVVVSWWALRLLQTRRPLQEKMVVFWHNHFATSAEKVKVPMDMVQQNEVLRRNGLGNFKTLLKEVSQDPAMIFWLDNEYNVKGKPNENFAREVMELFTLGIGNYTEKDIQEAARAFTGWGIGRPGSTAVEDVTERYRRYTFRPRLHDDGQKTVFGQTGAFTGEDILDMLCSKPECAAFIAKKMWSFFAYRNPEPELVQRLATAFQGAGLDIKALVKAIMTAPEFYSDRAQRSVYKTPVDFVVATSRQLGLGQVNQERAAENPRLALGPAARMVNVMKSMGMHLMYPPDVSGWEQGAAWITTATMVERIGWADTIFGATRGTGRGSMALRLPVYQFLGTNDPAGAVKAMLSIFDAPMPAAKVQTLVAAAQKVSGGTVTQENALETAHTIARLIFASPEFQMM